MLTFPNNNQIFNKLPKIMNPKIPCDLYLDKKKLYMYQMSLLPEYSIIIS